EGAERGQHIGDEENEPVEAVETAGRWLGGQWDGNLVCRRGQVASEVASEGRPETAGGADHDQRPAVAGFGRGPALAARQIERDAVIPAAGWREAQRAPVDRDLAVPDAEKAAEVDDGRAHLPAPVHHDVDHASHVLASIAKHLPAEDRLDILL